jgi:N-acetylneuraminic acid mutarotase
VPQVGDRKVTFILLLFLSSLLVALPNTEIVRATEDSWTTMEPMPTARSSLGVAVVDGKIYAMGGSYGSNGVEEYDPVTNTWSTKTPMPTPRILFGIAVVENKIYVIGGDSGNWTAGETLTNVNQVYDPAIDTWETRTSMPTKRLGLSASVVDGKIYLIGGRIGEPTYAGVSATEVYDPSTDTWTTVDSIPTPVSYHASAVVGNKIYIMGGSTRNTVGVNLTQIYDPETDTWSSGASLPIGVDGAAAGVTAGDTATQRIFVIGGKRGLDAVNLNQVYDPKTDTWVSGPAMPTARYGLGVAVVDNGLYAIGGREGWFGSPTSAANERYTPSDFIPEFSSWTPMLLVLTGLAVTVAIYRRRLHKKQYADK